VACRGRRCGIPLIVDDFTVLWDRYIFHEVLNVCVVKIETRLVNQGLRIFFQSEAFVPMVAIVILRGRWVGRQNWGGRLSIFRFCSEGQPCSVIK
jgi:hypothetical protein